MIPDIISNSGDIVTFGTYPQTAEGTDRTPVRWIVLKKEEDRALLITEQGIAAGPVHTPRMNRTWETCSLREWLNGPFFEAAFSEEEQSAILETKVPADRNPKQDFDPGNETNDRLFLLSYPEAERYFVSEEARQCKPTAYAAANHALVSERNGNGWWWLRSPGMQQNRNASVDIAGCLSNVGAAVSRADSCIRPALWIRLK